MIIKCSNCNHYISDTATICPHCGVAVNDSTSCSENDVEKLEELSSVNNHLSEMQAPNSKSIDGECEKDEGRGCVGVGVSEKRNILKKYLPIAIAICLLAVGGVWWFLSSSKDKDADNVKETSEEVVDRDANYDEERSRISDSGGVSTIDELPQNPLPFTVVYTLSDDGFLNVRSIPSNNGEVLAKVYGPFHGLGNGILRKRGEEWSMVSVGDVVGWCYNKFIGTIDWYSGGGETVLIAAQDNTPIYCESYDDDSEYYLFATVDKGTIIADVYDVKDEYYVLTTAHDNLFVKKKDVICRDQNARATEYTRSANPDYAFLSRRELTASDLVDKSKNELELMRNSVYARHGYIFKRKDLSNYFSQYSWYSPQTSDMASVYNSMSDLEKYNVNFIKLYE